MKTVFTSTISKLVIAICLLFTSLSGYSQCTVVAPGPITGIKNVCLYIGTGEQLTYSFDPIPGATSYQWVIPPTNVTLISGQGTNSITVTFQNGYPPQANKQLRVRAIFPCGISTYTIFYTHAQLPGTPTNIIPSSTNLCEYIGTTNQVSYTTPAVVGTRDYYWTVPPVGAIVTHVNGMGRYDTTILVTYTSAFISGLITVQAANDCGVSQPRVLPVSATIPGVPGLINGYTDVCESIFPSVTPANFSISPVVGALSYDWTTPPGCTVTHPNGTGPNDNAISVIFPSGFTTGTISVTVTTGCGTSAPRTLIVNRLLPLAPGIITAAEISGCPNRIYTYTIQSFPPHSNNILWTVPTAAGAVLVSGQGTLSITVSYPGDVVNGIVSATSLSNCGISVPRNLFVHLPQCIGPRQSARTTIAENTNSIRPASETMTVQVLPNPTAGDFKVKIFTNDNAPINIRILDISGRLLKRIDSKRNETISFGNDLKPGNYIMEVIQGGTRKIQQLVKL